MQQSHIRKWRQLVLDGVLEEETEAPNGTLGLWEMTLAMTPLIFTPWSPQLVHKGMVLFLNSEMINGQGNDK